MRAAIYIDKDEIIDNYIKFSAKNIKLNEEHGKQKNIFVTSPFTNSAINCVSYRFYEKYKHYEEDMYPEDIDYDHTQHDLDAVFKRVERHFTDLGYFVKLHLAEDPEENFIAFRNYEEKDRF